MRWIRNQAVLKAIVIASFLGGAAGNVGPTVAATATPEELGVGSASEQRCDRRIPSLIRERAEAGIVSAQFGLAMEIIKHACDEPDGMNALIWLERAADAGHGHAAYMIGEFYLGHDDENAHLSRALGYLGRAAETGHVQAQHRLGIVRLWSAVSEAQRAQGLYWLGAAAAGGHGFSAVALGRIHAQGLHGVDADACLAFDWYSAAKQLEAGEFDFVDAFIERHRPNCL